MEVLRSISGNTSGMPVRAISANEVWLPKWSSMLSAYTFAPYRSAANLLGDARERLIFHYFAHARSGGRSRARVASRQIFGNVAPALSEPLRVRDDRGDLIDARIGVQHQAVVNIEHRFSQDRHIIMGREIIEACGNGPFKGVLSGNNAVIGNAHAPHCRTLP